MREDTIFHKIVRGDAKAYKVWEDEEHLAFLSIFPNTEGVTVVIPKNWQPSYFADVDDDPLTKLVLAAKKVAKLLDEKLDDVGRTAMVFEGFGVNYLHAKLFPMHGTSDMKDWKPINSQIDDYYEKYQGFISTHDAKLADETDLEELSKRLYG